MISQYKRLFGFMWNVEGRDDANGTVITPLNVNVRAPDTVRPSSRSVMTSAPSASTSDRIQSKP